jgi:hypothetical protein
MEASDSPIPDFDIPRPQGWSALEAEAFERIYAAQVEQRRDGREIDYRLDVPKWKW